MIDKCSQCGTCCNLFLINLSEKEYYSGKYKTQLEKFGLIENFNKALDCGANILKQKKNGSCFYLKHNNCSIHKTRPQVCKKFFCASKSSRFQNMVEMIERKKLETKYYVYILRTCKDTLYIGQTNNLEKRLKEHQSKSTKSAKYMKCFASFQLVYSEKYPTRTEAMRREYQLKHWSKSKKETLIREKF